MNAIRILDEYIKKKDYKKIHKLLLKMNIDEPDFDQSIINIDQYRLIERKKEVLKIIIKNDIQFLLINKKMIRNELLMVIQLLDNDFNNEIRSITSHNIIKNGLDDIRKELSNDVQISCVSKWILAYKTKLDEIKFKYMHLPPSWNLSGEFTYNFCLLMKNYIQNALIQKYDNSVIIDALFKILEFEDKVLRFCFVPYCCTKKNKDINFHKSDIIIGGNIKKNEIVIYSGNQICIHKKILSQCFLDYLDIYLHHLCTDISRLKLEQNRIDMKIYFTFIHFFNLLNTVFIRLLYFKHSEILCKLVTNIDNKLCSLISEMPKSNSIFMASINLNSLLYIETTFNNFLDTIYKSTNTNFTNLKYMTNLRKKEIVEYNYIDKNTINHFKPMKTIKNFSICDHVYKIIQRFVLRDDYYEYYDEIVIYLLETVLAVLFSVIIKSKIDQTTAENVLAEITDLKRLIMIRIEKIPFLSIIECYLKIFLIDPHNTKDFIENFRNFGAKNFNFAQILKMLEDDSNNLKLFMEYKKIYDEQES